MTRELMIDPGQEWAAVYEPTRLPATIAEGLDARLLDHRWRPRDDRGRFLSWTARIIENRSNPATRD
jgi:hypothetical protein